MVFLALEAVGIENPLRTEYNEHGLAAPGAVGILHLDFLPPGGSRLIGVVLDHEAKGLAIHHLYFPL